MSETIRPRRGLPPEEALKRWSDDQKLYAEMEELSDAWQPCSTAAGHPPSPRVLRHQEYAWRREILEEAFLKKLGDGSVIASGRPNGLTTRQVIDPDQWDELEVDYMLDEIVGYHLIYRKPEFFDPSAIPLNIRDIPVWLAAPAAGAELPTLVPDAKYRHVTVGDTKFTFGATQARVIAILHKERVKSDEWCVGKNVMQDAESRQESLGELFKKKKNIGLLIEGDGQGGYRLKAR